MSELIKLVGKGKKIKVGELELEIKPLTISDMPAMMEAGREEDPKTQAEAMKTILTRTLKDSVPGATEEEINKISIEHLTKIMEAIMEVNKLGEVKNTEFMEHVRLAQQIRNKKTG